MARLKSCVLDEQSIQEYSEDGRIVMERSDDNEADSLDSREDSSDMDISTDKSISNEDTSNMDISTDKSISWYSDSREG